MGNIDRKYIHLLYNSRRTFTYSLLGGLFGFFGYVVGDINLVVSGQIVVSLVAGIIMILIGFQILGLLRETTLLGLFPFLRKVKDIMKNFLRKNSYKNAFSLGLFNGFLPCPLVYTFLLISVSRASLWEGIVIMFLMGMGAVPAMFFLGMMSSLSPSLRGNISRYVPAL